MQQLCYYKLFNYFENEKKLSIEQSKYTKAGFHIFNDTVNSYIGVTTPLDDYCILKIIDDLKGLKLDYGTLVNNSRRDNSKITKYESILNSELYNPHCS